MGGEEGGGGRLGGRVQERGGTGEEKWAMDKKRKRRDGELEERQEGEEGEQRRERAKVWR